MMPNALTKQISLAWFYVDCILAYFKPSTRWTARTPLNLLTRMAFYFCNWCYFFFLTAAESLAFLPKTRLNQVDRSLYRRYFHPSQFWLALREGLKIEGPETLYRLTYGETSWFAIRAILKQLNAQPEDVFYDLGCGTGRNVFYANLTYGMKAVGIDLLPSFVHYGNAVVQEQGLENIHFVEQDIFKTPLQEATLVYVTANCFDAQTMGYLVQRLQDLPVGARLVSTHRPIQAPNLQVIGSQRLPFTWGVDRVYYHQVVVPVSA